MGKDQLKAWLAPSSESTGFTLALLEDLFIDDAEVREWLGRGRREFDGLSPSELMHSGRTGEVEALLVRLWNARSPSRIHPGDLKRTRTA